MLYALESQLAVALAAALPQGVQIRAGPPAGPPGEGEERVEVVASRLEVLTTGEDPFAVREPAALLHIHRWSADGATRDFTFPAVIQGEVLEVESPAGHPVRLGEDYQLDGATLRFYRPPAQGVGAVVATVRLGRARGFQERRPCRARLLMTSWAASLARADELLERALASVLTTTLEVGTLDAGYLVGTGARMRLHEPAVLLQTIERAQVQTGTRWTPSAVAELRIHGQLDLVVALGASEPEGRIQEIQYTVTRSR